MCRRERAPLGVWVRRTAETVLRTIPNGRPCSLELSRSHVWGCRAWAATNRTRGRKAGAELAYGFLWRAIPTFDLARRTVGALGRLDVHRLLPLHRAGGLVVAQAHEDRDAHAVVARPFLELDLADELRPHPVDGHVGLGHFAEGAFRRFERAQALADVDERLRVETAAGVADVDQVAPFVDAEDQGTEFLPRAPRVGEPADD